jgi:hypothetical protein
MFLPALIPVGGNPLTDAGNETVPLTAENKSRYSIHIAGGLVNVIVTSDDVFKAKAAKLPLFQLILYDPPAPAIPLS